ncbi:hypothetical protein BC834DRAFT_952694 [Gloeopeniophorella convolvens]|nr:hypothetical protein BC834DRAFT_952694 [Gloeopeniophorella convolvens]
MIRSRLRARLFSTASTSAKPTVSRARISSVVFFTSTGLLTASYFLWPSKYRGSPTFVHKPLSPSYFVPVTVTENSPAGPNLTVLTLSIPPDSRAVDKHPTSFDPVWSIFIKDDDIQVERPYTPLHGMDEHGNIKLWIKKYPRGEVGRWLHTKQPGDTIEIRGPLKTFPFYDKTWDEVVMISGGTGFSPFHQLLFRRLLQDNVVDNTRFTLLHASRSPAELPPPPLLQPLLDFAALHPERLRIRLFVDNKADIQAPDSVSGHLEAGRIDKSSIARLLDLSDGSRTWASWIGNLWAKGQGTEAVDVRRKNVLVLICGPEPMVAAIAGPYGRNYSQGAVGGALAELGFGAGQVWKL